MAQVSATDMETLTLTLSQAQRQDGTKASCSVARPTARSAYEAHAACWWEQLRARKQSYGPICRPESG